jgi:acetamidase/formamidase
VATHQLDDAQPHAFWDNSLAPRARIQPGDTVVLETLEGTGQITPKSGDDALAHLDDTKIHALTGPVYVEGAEPGDTLVVDVVSLEHRGWGWNGVIPGFGLLAGEFEKPYIHHYRLERGTCFFTESIRIPFEPFCGVMGVARAGAGRSSTIPPRENGGNVDIRHLTAGSRVFLPVLVAGALFSCGDCHAAQGDGEVNGTGIETPMEVTLSFELVKGETVSELRFLTPAGKPLTAAGADGYFATTAHGPDLFEGAQRAIRYVIDHLEADRGLTREQAYCLCGAAVDLKISEIVDEPNWIVSAYLPLSLFED